MDPHSQLSRRDLLHRGAGLGAAVAAGTILAACSPATKAPSTTPGPAQEEVTTTPSTPGRTLLAYFSRPGENYYNGGRRNLDVGNTEVLARMISNLVDCDTYRIEAAEPYSNSYDATVARNQDEQNSSARPAIAKPLESIEQYDTVLVGSPIWNVRPPMIMLTFLESHDFAGKTVLPFVTYAVSGLGRTETVYSPALTGARLQEGLAVRGEEVADHRGDVEAWLRQGSLLP